MYKDRTTEIRHDLRKKKGRGLNVALKSMQDAAARDLANAEAANMKAKLLTPTQPEKGDANIALAMQAAAGKPAAPSTLSDRLAALRTRS